MTVPIEPSEVDAVDATSWVDALGGVVEPVEPVEPGEPGETSDSEETSSPDLSATEPTLVEQLHLRGLVEALVFASDGPLRTGEIAKLALAPRRRIGQILVELAAHYAERGIRLDEVGGGWAFRTSPQFGPFVRDLTKQKPVRLTRAQVETLAIIAYRQPVTRPEIDDVRGVDSGPVLKVLLERELVRILGKRDEPGRPLIYGTTSAFLEFFGLRSLKELPTLREFTELSDESRDTYEDELGESSELAHSARDEQSADARATHEEEPAPVEEPTDASDEGEGEGIRS